MIFDLKLGNGKVVEWEGKDGVDASYRYADAHREATVVAWRDHVETNVVLVGSGHLARLRLFGSVDA